ncbi:MAG TPA: nucleotide exchange factor GrpE [Accumulibacter sp.]|nr:nucleotide exchange factor GrpE [Accumulibacter sp.]HMW18037.1 nucleotide exchange factor GrpE [Accumulibacter sp.]HMX23966.1 nucleotide exchange factor GrpE [Accumulibacter sp.]HMY05938.1 nucleotide exchange factor GrpE [Accumulibacter sp.]HNC16507.1 nucleotide exchange factor GrpE [Accumulibacter sp.]
MQDNKETTTDSTCSPQESALPGEVPAEMVSTEAVDAMPDALQALQQALHEAQTKADEYHDAWLRAKAETENVRRRAQEDIAKAAKFAIERFAKELLAVKDSLDAALATENASVESFRAGSELTLKQLNAAFEKSALTEIAPQGQKFDPHRHQAISVVDSDQEPNTVVNVLQKGYLLADRVLRPALVIVAKSST